MLDKQFYTLQQLAVVLSGSSETPVLDCRFFLAEILQVTLGEILYGVSLCPRQYMRLQLMMQRRCQGEPVAYILGYTEFWGLRLRVMPGVLIPRSDTECLVEQVLQDYGKESLRGLDLGTGSAAISLALASERSNWSFDAIESSEVAVRCARHNCAMHSNIVSQVNIWHASWINMPGALLKQSYNFIVANPPYIAPGCTAVMESVRRFEPEEALFAQDDGLAALREIIALAPQYLLTNGALYLEHGYQQAALVRDLLHNAGFFSIRTQQDFSGYDRVSMGIYPL